MGQGWIAASRQFFEEETGRQLVTAIWEYRLDCFPSGSAVIELPHPPLRQVLSVIYLDAQGELVPFVDYDTQAPQGPSAPPGVIAPKFYTPWPRIPSTLGAVSIVYRAGYGGSNDIPASIKTCLGMVIAHFFKFRGEITTASVTDVSLGARQMLRALKNSADHGALMGTLADLQRGIDQLDATVTAELRRVARATAARVRDSYAIRLNEQLHLLLRPHRRECPRPRRVESQTVRGQRPWPSEQTGATCPCGWSTAPGTWPLGRPCDQPHAQRVTATLPT